MRAKAAVVLVVTLLLAGVAFAQPPLAPTQVRFDDPPVAQKDDKADAKEEKKDDEKNGKDSDKKAEKDKKPEGPPRTLLKWTLFQDDSDEPEEPEEDVIVTDRPDFTEASSTVGLGWIQFESGYTYARQSYRGTVQKVHTFPEGLLRIGMFADWFEWRLGWNYNSQQNREGVLTASDWGADDVYVGTKLFLAEQAKILPEVALILQATVPTGANGFGVDRILPGVNLLYGWDVTEFLSIGGSIQANKAVDSLNHDYLEGAQSITIGYTFTKQWGAYTEWFVLFPSGSIDPGVGPQHYFNGGFTYKLTPNIQFDIRAGVGLNEHARGYFAGMGSAFRF